MSGALGRIALPDARDFPVARAGFVMPRSVELPLYHYWTASGLPLDQGPTPMCVGFSARGLLNSGPVKNMGGPAPEDIYRHAQQLDEIPGEAYEGTTARGAMKYLQAQGYVSAYVWPATVEETVAWLLTRGPCLIGSDWLTSFDHTGTDGVMRIAPNATVRGGHEYLAIGAHRGYQRIRVMNSWGKWAQNGRAWLPFDVLGALLSSGADICAPTEVMKP